jgi:hypothetical protein
MKGLRWVITGIVLLAIVFSAFRRQDLPGSIKGKVVPYNAALNVWAVSDRDTAHGVVQSGSFEIRNIKEGRYRVIVEGLRPYKTTTKPEIMVSSGIATDIGDVILDQ